MEISEDSFNLERVPHDYPELFTNDQSGYFVLLAPEAGWTSGLYRVDLFIGDEVAAYNQVDEVRFRIVAFS